MLNKIKLIIKASPFAGIASYILKYIRKIINHRFVINCCRKIKYYLGDLLDDIGFNHSLNVPLFIQIDNVLRKTSNKTIKDLTRVDNKAPKVLFATVYGFTPNMLAFESTVAVALKFRGIQPYFIKCDKSLPACEWNRWGNRIPDPGIYGPDQLHDRKHNCDVCTHGYEGVIDKLNFPIISFSSYSNTKEIDKQISMIDELTYKELSSYIYKDIKIGREALGSTIRSTEIGSIEENDETRWILRRYVLAGMSLVDKFEKIINEKKPDYIIGVHGIYLTHGILGQIARKHGININFWDGPWANNTIHLEKDYAPLNAFKKTIENNNLGSLNLEKEKQVINLIKKNRQDASEYHGLKDPIKSSSIIKKELGVNNDNIITIFTNVAHDAEVFYQSKIFPDMLSWLFYTIDYFIDNQDIDLIIRSHPSEAYHLIAKQKVIPEILKKYGSVPKNIKLVPPESRFSTYTLLDISKATIVYGTTVGLESTIIGIPAILASKTYYENNFSFSPNSRGEYDSLLNKILNLEVSDNEKQMAINISYHIFFKSKIPFEPIQFTKYGKDEGLIKLRYRNFEDLENQYSTLLNKICNKIVS